MSFVGHRFSRTLLVGALSASASLAIAQPSDAQPANDGAAQPPVAQPPAAQPPAAQPPVAQPPAAQPPVAQPPVPAPAIPPKAPLTPEELVVMAETEQDLIRYEQAALQHHRRMQAILVAEYRDRKSQLEARYAEKIGNAEQQEQERRLKAIALLEKFIKDHPAHEQFTPDAMFRLADLYLDQAEYDFERTFDEDYVPEDDDEAMATADYSKALALWEQIVREFPTYRQKASTLYLLGYYLKQTEEERRALQVFRGLVCSNKYEALAEPQAAPDPALARAAFGEPADTSPITTYDGCEALTDNKELLDDVWVRGIGDIHFLTPGELREAIASYRKVADNEKSPFFDEALYKLAWSYYRNDDFELGIQAFDRSVVYSDSLVAKGGEPLELRPEAVQYIAISFTDPWSVEEQPDPVRSYDRAMAFYKDRMSEPHVRDVFIALGDTFSILEAYTQAADSYRIAVTNWPLESDNPVIHQKIVNAFEEMGDSDLADEEAARLAIRYKPGSEWYAANETNREAMENQARIGERMLRAAAENTHKAAQGARQNYLADPTEDNRLEYMRLYEKAATLYEQFLGEYPTSEMSYEFTFRLGEVLFFAERYPEAIVHYTWVRDHRDLSEERFEKAARSIVQCYQKELEKLVAANQVSEPKVPTIEELAAMPKPVAAMSIPQAWRDLQNALDEYQQLVNDPQTAPNMGFEAALISYRHLDLADAERRFKVTLDKFCGSSESVKSKDALLAIYEAQGDDEKFEQTNRDFIESKCGSDDDVALAQAQNRSKEFRKAEALFKEEKYAQAALAFYTFYKTAPQDDPNLPIALYNSAIAYDKSGKPKTAVFLFKEFTSNQAPMYKDSEYYLPALYLTAVSYYKAFDYDNAVDVYLQVVKAAADKSRKPPAGERSAEDMRLDALFNAANLRELDRVYKDPKGAPGTGAASLFERYAALEKDQRKADRALFAVARVWKGAQLLSKQEAAYATWRSKYGRRPENKDDYVFSFYDMAKQYEKKGISAKASKAKAATLKAWVDVGSPKNSVAGDLAAEFAFEQAEAYYNKNFTPFKIKRAPKTKNEADKVLGNLDKTANDSQKKYTDLAKYESGPWALAARTRIGDIRYFQALKIAEIPIPKEIERLDEKFPDKDILLQYEDAIADLVKPLEEAARTEWEKVVEAGRNQQVSNEWTQLANERLHDFVSQDEFPVLRQELREGTEEP